MEEETGFEICIAILAVFLVFGSAFHGASWLYLLTFFAVIVGAFYLIRGAIGFFFGTEHGETHFWVGAMFLVLLILVFGALPQALFSVKAILLLIGGALVLGVKAFVAALAI